MRRKGIVLLAALVLIMAGCSSKQVYVARDNNVGTSSAEKEDDVLYMEEENTESKKSIEDKDDPESRENAENEEEVGSQENLENQKDTDNAESGHSEDNAEGGQNTGKDGSVLQELKKSVSEDVDKVIASLEEEYEKLTSDIDTYDKYLENTEAMEVFYKTLCRNTRDLCIRMREYSIDYAEEILASDKRNDDKYDDLEEIYDDIYDGAGDEIYDEIYDGILDEAYDDFYGGILEDAYDTAESYSEWSEMRSLEYDWWLGARSEVYEEWLDFRSDVYDFWLDLRSELWGDDMEEAEEVIADFREDVEKQKRKSAIGSEEAAGEESSAVVSEDAETEDPNEESNEGGDLVDGMRPEFKEAMDSYEGFYDEYCDFMKKYAENPADRKLLAEYSDMMLKVVEMSEKFKEWDNSEMNRTEKKYYLEVNTRVTQKLLEVSQGQ